MGEDMLNLNASDSPQGGGEPQYRKWNWGAFSYNWVFGFANKAWLALLCLIPLFGFIWMFFCGAKGERWAWESGNFADENSFQATMTSWNRAGFLGFIINIVCLVLVLLFYGSIIAMILAYSD